MRLFFEVEDDMESKRGLIIRLVVLAALLVLLVIGIFKTVPPLLTFREESDKYWGEILQYESESESMAAEMEEIEAQKVVTYSAKLAGEEVANLQQTWSQRMQEMRKARVDEYESEASDAAYEAEIKSIQTKLAQYISLDDKAYCLWLDPTTDVPVAWSFRTVWDFTSKSYRVTWFGLSSNTVFMRVQATYDADTNMFSDFEMTPTGYLPYVTHLDKGAEVQAPISENAFTTTLFAFWENADRESSDDDE